MPTSDFRLTSSAFVENGEIPKRYTCEGEDVSPPLSWSGAPAETKSFAIIVDDPDAPDPLAPKTTWVHWVLFNIPPDIERLPEDLHKLPQNSAEGRNDWKVLGYRGPCPPIGKHHYHHKIYALDTVLEAKKIATKQDLEKSMQGHILAEAQLVALYQKSATGGRAH